MYWWFHSQFSFSYFFKDLRFEKQKNIVGFFLNKKISLKKSLLILPWVWENDIINLTFVSDSLGNKGEWDRLSISSESICFCNALLFVIFRNLMSEKRSLMILFCPNFIGVDRKTQLWRKFWKMKNSKNVIRHSRNNHSA